VSFLEYAVDTAIACRERGIKAVAVTAGYLCAEPRAELFAHLDAANVDLKAFTEGFYEKICAGSLAPVLETLEHVRHETDCWLEVTTLLIPGLNDSDAELDELTRWVVERLGPDVPLHFSAFHPDHRLRDRPTTPPATLARARRIARANGLRYVYTGNVHDPEGQSTWCHVCGALLVERDGYRLGAWNLDRNARCTSCGEALPGVFEARPGSWGSRRMPVRLAP
jgi:pyruvate formate lyase activating enzyme